MATERLEMQGRIIISHPSGNQFFRHLAIALREAGLLERAYTCIDTHPESRWTRLLPAGVRAELGRRSFSREIGVRLSSHPWREAARLIAGRLGWRSLTTHETGILSVDAVYRDFDRWVAARLDRAPMGGIVYAYEDAAEATFLAAQRTGRRRVYDLPIAYWETSRRLLAEEAERWPEWEPTLLGTRDSVEKHDRKSRELALAEIVVCPSRFVAKSLPPTVDARRVVIAPFGSPPAASASSRSRTGRMRVLFAGGITQRKGLADLFAAVRLLDRRDIELVVMGSPVIDLEFYRRQAEFVYEAPRAHAEVLALMRRCDVLCLPSIVEGRALVVQEAMSAGLPAIVTPNTGADDVVTDGRTGFIVPIRSPQSIAEKLAWCADRRADVAAMGIEAAQATARYSWPRYGATIVAALREFTLFR